MTREKTEIPPNHFLSVYIKIMEMSSFFVVFFGASPKNVTVARRFGMGYNKGSRPGGEPSFRSGERKPTE